LETVQVVDRSDEGNGEGSRLVNEAKGKGAIPRPFLLSFDSENQEEQTDYECKAMPDDFAFRNTTTASPRSPVPSNSRLDGSGV
jgi:hypothetical protein